MPSFLIHAEAATKKPIKTNIFSGLSFGKCCIKTNGININKAKSESAYCDTTNGNKTSKQVIAKNNKSPTMVYFFSRKEVSIVKTSAIAVRYANIAGTNAESKPIDFQMTAMFAGKKSG